MKRWNMWLTKTNQVGTVEAALVANFLFEGGIPVDGAVESNEHIVETAWTTNQGRPFYVVRDWFLLDVMVPSDVEDGLKAMGLQPTVVYAETVVYDSRTEDSRLGAIRSSFQRVLDGCTFESMNTSFILAGPGIRKYVSLPALLALENI
ncbi:hypothetical protein D3C81_1440050 [compost metagenome]